AAVRPRKGPRSDGGPRRSGTRGPARFDAARGQRFGADRGSDRPLRAGDLRDACRGGTFGRPDRVRRGRDQGLGGGGGAGPGRRGGADRRSSGDEGLDARGRGDTGSRLHVDLALGQIRMASQPEESRPAGCSSGSSTWSGSDGAAASVATSPKGARARSSREASCELRAVTAVDGGRGGSVTGRRV